MATTMYTEIDLRPAPSTDMFFGSSLEIEAKSDESELTITPPYGSLAAFVCTADEARALAAALVAGAALLEVNA